MSNVTTIPGLDIDPSDFWVANGLLAQNETFGGLVKQVGSLVAGIGNSTSTFNELKFDVGDLTYHYVGDWALNVIGNGLTSTTTASGSYDKVLIEKAGDVIAELDLDKALDVAFQKDTGVNLLGLNLSDLVNPILETLLGDGVDLDVANLHLEVNPELENLVHIGTGGDTPTPTPTGGPTNGNDVLIGTPLADKIDGLGGNDQIYGRAGADILHGGTGDDKIWGEGGSDKLFGDSGKDMIHGAGGKDRLTGGAGTDTLYGDGGGDRISGGAGKDLIAGGKGHDVLIGGKGADVFDFNIVTESTVAKGGRDMIADFSHGQKDRIDLSTIDADSGTGGDQSFTFIGRHGFDHTAGELRFVKQHGDTFVQGDINGDGKADFSIQLDHAINLHANDFIL